LEVHISN